MAYNFGFSGNQEDTIKKQNEDLQRRLDEAEAAKKEAEGKYNSYMDANYEAALPGYSDAPRMKKWQSLIDPATGQLKKEYQLTTDLLGPDLQKKLDQTNLSTDAMDKYRKFALSDGDSDFAKFQLQQANLNRQNALEGASKNAANQAAQARSQMAMRGGINSGSAERLARSSMLSNYNARQGINRQNLADQLSIRANDAKDRTGALVNLQNMNQQAYQNDIGKVNTWMQGTQFDINNKNKTGEYNINNALSEFQKGRDRDQFIWGEQMKAWSGNKQAAAQKPDDK